MLLADFEQIPGYVPRGVCGGGPRRLAPRQTGVLRLQLPVREKRGGDAALLARLCGERGIEAVTVPPVEVDGRPVSASRIRRLIEAGEVKEAARLLGRPFTLDFNVVGGQKLGRLLGTPTINQPLPAHFVRPRFGVYASSVEVDGRVTHGVTNIGVRPTVGADAPLAETWIADFTGDLYGKAVPVSLVQFLRPEQKFESVEELQRQILRDGREARRAVLGDSAAGIRAVLFDFDDTLQDRSRAFDKFTAFFMDKYFPHLSGEEKARPGNRDAGAEQWGICQLYRLFRLSRGELALGGCARGGRPVPGVPVPFSRVLHPVPRDKRGAHRAAAAGVPARDRHQRPLHPTKPEAGCGGLRPFVDLCMVSGDEQVHKPDPEIFRRAASRLGVACGSCLYVGDHPVNDIEGAAAAGMRPVYINAARRDFHPDNVIEIHSLRELLDVV